MDYWQEITDELITQGVLTKTELHALTPPIQSNIIPRLINNNIAAAVVAAVVAKVAGFSLYQGDNSDDMVIEDEVLYLTNPLNQDTLKQKMINNNNGSISFKKIGIKSASGKQNKKNKVSLLNNLINFALDNDATDIHISPRNKDTIYIRVRIQGQLINAYEDISFEEYETFLNLVLNEIDKSAGVFSKPIDGQFNFSDDCSIRVSMLAVDYRFASGFIVTRTTLRILNSGDGSIRSLDDLNLSAYSKEQILCTTNKKQGLIYITGPTGSGKSTFGYMLIKEIQANRSNISIATVEDPIEKNLPGVDQTQINEKAGITFSSVSKAFMRLDPDVLLVGETRDETTAKNTMSLANTGHLTISTLHTNDAISVVSRLYDLGIPYGQISDMLTTVVATRLLRELCGSCALEVKVSADQEIYQRALNYFDLDGAPIMIKDAKGCDHCNKGYVGRVSVCEVFQIDKNAKHIISNGFNQSELINYFSKTQKQGFFWNYGFYLLFKGIVSYDELVFLLPNDPLFDEASIEIAEVIVQKYEPKDKPKDEDLNKEHQIDNTEEVKNEVEDQVNADIDAQTIANVAELFIDELQKDKPKGVKTKIKNIRQVVKKFGEEKPIVELSIDSIQTFKKQRLRTIKEASADKETTCLIQLLDFYNNDHDNDKEAGKQEQIGETDGGEMTPEDLNNFLKTINGE